jgi:hypothetical protein
MYASTQARKRDSKAAMVHLLGKDEKTGPRERPGEMDPAWNERRSGVKKFFQ